MSIDFIGIGAHKAGSTWLYDQLRNLDEFALPPIKELHYFDRSNSYISPNTISKTNFSSRVVDPKWLLTSAKDFGRSVRDQNDWNDFDFLLRWHSMEYSDENYKSLFDTWHSGKIKGEITPAYSILNKEDIKKMFDLNPKLKIVFQLRDPISRGWSHCRYFKQDVLGATESTISFINGDDFSFRGDYVKTIENYLSVFPPDQILITYFDGIVIDPKKLLAEIVEFLGGSTSDFGQLSLNKKSNSSREIEMPEVIYDALKVKYRRSMKMMAVSYGSFASLWYRKHFGYESLIKEDDLVFSFHP